MIVLARQCKTISLTYTLRNGVVAQRPDQQVQDHHTVAAPAAGICLGVVARCMVVCPREGETIAGADTMCESGIAGLNDREVQRDYTVTSGTVLQGIVVDTPKMTLSPLHIDLAMVS